MFALDGILSAVKVLLEGGIVVSVPTRLVGLAVLRLAFVVVLEDRHVSPASRSP